MACPETRDSCCEKYKLIFVLRNRTDEGAVQELIKLFHSTPSVLLRHEVAYVLGQMRRVDAVPFLSGLLRDQDEHPITRHEAAEALGAIEAPESLSILAEHAADSSSEVSDTCGLALSLLNYKIQKGACGCEARPQNVIRLEAVADVQSLSISDEEAKVELTEAPVYNYVSPAPAAEEAPVEILHSMLLDQKVSLFERYRALFALRDAVPKQGDSAVHALCDLLLLEGDALLKHEIAFVLGQLMHPASTKALCRAVQCEEEHSMVRHEAAEALGAIGSPEVMDVLRKYCDHSDEILRESCWVALHMYDREAFLSAGVVV